MAHHLAQRRQIARRVVGGAAKAHAGLAQIAGLLVELAELDEIRHALVDLGQQLDQPLDHGDGVLALADLDQQIGQRQQRFAVVGLELQHALVRVGGALGVVLVARVDAPDAQEDLAQPLGRTLGRARA